MSSESIISDFSEEKEEEELRTLHDMQEKKVAVKKKKLATLLSTLIIYPFTIHQYNPSLCNPPGQYNPPLFLIQIVKKQNYSFFELLPFQITTVVNISRDFIFADRKIIQISQRQVFVNFQKNREGLRLVILNELM